MHEAQRELYNKYMKIAVAIDMQTLFLVIDTTSQNESAPCLARDQMMGDFYYIYPLLHYIVGVCEAAR